MRTPRSLRRGEDFRSIGHRGTRARDRGLTVIVAAGTPGEPARLGLTIPRAVGGAVVRNRLRRRLREAWRALEPPPGIDVVVQASSEAVGLSFQELEASLRDALRRAT